MEPCRLTRAVVAAFAAGELLSDPQLSAHVQVCTRCLGAIFDHDRDQPPAPRVEAGETAPPRGAVDPFDR